MSASRFPCLPDTTGLEIRVVRSEQDLIKAFLVRGIVYMHEQNCPYDEEFDLNDFTSTQILGLVDGEPALTGRIRYFAGFAKLERLAIREAYRGRGYGHALLQFMLRLCEEKGYREFYLHAQKRLESFYEQYGFHRLGDNFHFSEHDYVEMYARFPVAPAGLTVAHGPMVLNRPEGAWARPGPLEQPQREAQQALQRAIAEGA
ncbi:GNAT family N-acetyltransferase [Archangium violaceum]|uniref:GNAT family N-acetyltransferase n=1 Tax=Archangium violaceum TaxID=83451 RepID=UPI002B31DD09|nr:GNAT family N-acetyltransferase [Archangium violaceum]